MAARIPSGMMNDIVQPGAALTRNEKHRSAQKLDLVEVITITVTVH
jgi:hypothetical protein